MRSIHLIVFIDVSTTGSLAYRSKLSSSIYVLDPERYNNDEWVVIDYRVIL